MLSKSENLQPCHSATKIQDGFGATDLVEYYMYKCSNTKDLTVSYSSGSDDRDLKRLLNVVKHANKLSLNSWCLEKIATFRRLASIMECQQKYRLLINAGSRMDKWPS